MSQHSGEYAHSLMQPHILQKPTHAIRTLDEVKSVSVEAGSLHLFRECQASDQHRDESQTSSAVIGGGGGGPAWCRYQV